MQDRSHSLGASALFFSLIQGFVKYSSLEWVRWAVGVGMAHRVEQGHEADLGGGQSGRKLAIPFHPAILPSSQLHGRHKTQSTLVALGGNSLNLWAINDALCISIFVESACYSFA